MISAGHAAMRRARPRPALVGLLLVLGALAGCDDEEAPPPRNELDRCGHLQRVYAQFGGTIGGPYAAAALADFRFTQVESSFEDRFFGAGPTRLGVRSPSGTACEDDIAARLEASCALCREGSFETCLLEVEAAFRTPSAACEVCGDGRCTGAETPTTCAGDCSCGDGTCDVLLGELPTSCPEDCPVSCGNGICEALGGETCGCPEGAAGCLECARDCCVVVCGDGTCDAASGETLESCEQDCGSGFCGDGLCLGAENPEGCPRDCPTVNCAICPTCYGSTFGLNSPLCGDGVCTGCEPWSCRLDCEGSGIDFCTVDENGQRTCPPAYCGDGECAGAEDYLTCAPDCPMLAEFGLELCSNQQCDQNDHVFFAWYSQLEQCTDIDLCAGTLCGDGYCQSGETPQVGSHPLEGEKVCAQDCGSHGCLEIDRAALCGEGLDPLRCELVELEVSPGAFVRFNAVVDCSLACPIRQECGQLCDDGSGEPQCIHCEGFSPTSAQPCDPGDPDVCIDDRPHFCRATSTPDEARPGCYVYTAAIESCDNGCNLETGQCNP